MSLNVDPYGAGSGNRGDVLARPGKVTTSAVLAFIVSAIAILGVVGLASLSDGEPETLIIIALTVLNIGLFIAGGVVALTGRDGRWLVLAAGLWLAAEVVSWIISGAEVPDILRGSFIRIGLPALIFILMMRPESQAWFKAKGGKTF